MVAGLNINQIAEKYKEYGVDLLRGKQIAKWCHHKGIEDFALMTDLPKNIRENLNNIKEKTPNIIKVQNSLDGTIKWLIGMNDNAKIECVFIPDGERGTLCVSSQVGCWVDCKFCYTGYGGFTRNLTAQEIVYQMFIAKKHLNDWSENRIITNIVFMGMGEPLSNPRAVCEAIEIIKDDKYGFGMSRKRITVSTVGIVPALKVISKTMVPLAISLHAPIDEIRSRIMPINEKYPLKELLPEIKKYLLDSNTDKVTFEYVMLENVNDTEICAKELIKILSKIPAKVNLIPLNKWEGCPFERSSDDRINKFAKIIVDSGYMCSVRRSRGDDVLAACGQLNVKSTTDLLEIE